MLQRHSSGWEHGGLQETSAVQMDVSVLLYCFNEWGASDFAKTDDCDNWLSGLFCACACDYLLFVPLQSILNYL